MPSVYREDGWVERLLTVAEVGSAVDLHVETSTSLALAAKFQPSILRDIVSLPPVKVVQATVELLKGTGHAKESVDPTPAGGWRYSLRGSLFFDPEC